MDHIGSNDIEASNERVTFGSALPSHTYDASSSRPAAPPTHTSSVPGKMTSPLEKSKQLPEREWEDLKDLLHRLYIQENKTLENIRKIMREKHGISLTQKQLTKRFAKWNFKKNVKQAEIEDFLQKTESTSGQTQFSIKGVRITAAKRERWEKRARTNPPERLQSSSASKPLGSGGVEGLVENSNTHQYEREFTGNMALNNSNIPSSYSRLNLSLKTIDPPTCYNSLDVPPSISLATLTSNTIDAKAPSSTLSSNTISPKAPSSTLSSNTISPKAPSSTLSSNTISPKAPSSTLSSNTISPKAPSSTHSSIKISPMALFSTLSPGIISSAAPDEPCIDQEDTTQPILPRSEWPLIPKSGDSELVLLRRLFSALSITPPANITPFCQSATTSETAIPDSETISIEDLIDLTHGGGDKSRHGTQMISHSVYKPFLRKRSAPSAFKLPGRDVIFPSETIVCAVPSLSGELYPFPTHEKSSFEVKSTSKYHDTLRLEMHECNEKISKFEISFSENNPAVIILIDRLAVAYFGLGNYDEAERQFNRILPILMQRHGSESRYVISVKRDLAEVILHLGRFTEANRMAQEVHASALAIDIPGGYLTQKSLQVLAQSYGNLHNLAKEEELLRELVQIRLASSGPWHGDTLAAIRSLADSTIDAERHSESEELLRVALELSQSAHDMSDRRKCLIFRKLATVLYKQCNYPESEACYRKTVDMCERLLGNEHPDTLRCRFWLCKVLRARGSLEESEKLLHQTIEKQVRTRGELRGSTIESMASLSTLLIQMKRMEEADVWMKRALRCSQQIGGIESTRTMKFWDDLGRLKEEEEQRGAIDLYEEMGREISTQVGPGSRSIEEMSKWSDRNRR